MGPGDKGFEAWRMGQVPPPTPPTWSADPIAMSVKWGCSSVVLAACLFVLCAAFAGCFRMAVDVMRLMDGA